MCSSDLGLLERVGHRETIDAVRAERALLQGVDRRDMLAARFETMPHGLAQARLMAAQAGVDAVLHFHAQVMHVGLHHDATSPQRRARPAVPPLQLQRDVTKACQSSRVVKAFRRFMRRRAP